ncbi:beta-lactamase family protein [Candidatus Acetothermia bacterium]|nr:beta-lactamase family protein [Candidatus Acetothermia bacterium]MBI3643461.1 beta-lactamase family protein [Candidatus Acetothermia bacterium]
MQRSEWLKAALISALLLLPSCQQQEKELYSDQPRCDPKFASLQDPVAKMMKDLNLTGAGLLLIWKGQTVCEAYLGGYNQDTTVPIVSAAKWLSAATILTLADDGTLSLDDLVSKYLPYFPGEKGAITLRELLSHTSGIDLYNDCMFQSVLTLDECAREVASMNLLASPGTQFNYSGAAFSVAGRMAEVASKMPWAEIFSTKMAQPLGLKVTTYGKSMNPMLSEGYVSSSLREYGVFLKMIAQNGISQGKRILTQNSIQEMESDQTTHAEIGYSPRDPSLRYGLGIWRDLVHPDGRPAQISSPGGGGFVPWIDYDRNLIGIVMFYDRIERVWPAVAAVQQGARDIIDQAH